MKRPELDKIISRLEEENEELKITVNELSILNEVAVAVSSSQSLDEIQNLIIKKCIKHLFAEEGIVMLLNKDEVGRPFQTMIRRKNSNADSLPFRLDDQMMGRMLEYKSAIIVNDFSDNEFFDTTSDEKSDIHSLLCVPMFVKGRLLGLIAVFNKKGEEGFTKNDQRLLAICASQAGQVIENARLYSEEQTLKKIQADMQLAREIQMNLLPKNPPDIMGYQIAGRSCSARDVGGDFYDFIPLSQNHIALFLGDISGKGIPASLLMSNLHAIIRTQCMLSLSCSECLTKSNKFLYENTEPDKFATLFYSVLNYKDHTLTFSSAGHDFPIYFSEEKDLKRLETGDTVLGIIPDYPFSEKKIEMQPDDLIVIYSDGVTEAENRNEEQFGVEKLYDLIKSNREEHPETLIEIITNSVKEFTGDVPQHDDITLLIIKRLNR